MRRLEIVSVVLFLLVAVPAAAEEIVYFTNGQSMPVRSTQRVNGMVHVDLGDNAFLAFPESAIERIETAGEGVALRPSYGTVGNRRVPTPEGSYPSQNFPRPQDRQLAEVEDSRASPVETDERTGLAQYRPQGNHPARNRRGMAASGNMRVLGNHPTTRGDGSTFTGTTQVGSRHVIGGVTPRRNPNAYNPNTTEPVSLTMKPGVGTVHAEAPRTPAPGKDSDDN